MKNGIIESKSGLGFSVDELVEELKKLQEEGMGNKTVFFHNKSNVPTPSVDKINVYPFHIVLTSDKQYRDE